MLKTRRIARKINNNCALTDGPLPSLSGGNADAPLPTNYPTKFPQVDILTNRIIQTIPKESFVWLEKTDGERNILLIEHNKVYRIKHGSIEYMFPIDGPNFVHRTILDTELFNGVYFIFDIIMINGNDISNKSYNERMKVFDPPLVQSLGSKIIPKTYELVTDWNIVVSFINNRKSPITGNIIDGVILQRVDLPYFSSEPTCYKLKKNVMNTIDFVLKYHPDGDKCKYLLYLMGGFNDYVFNLKRIPRINKFMKTDTSYDNNSQLPKSFNVLFSSPYREGLHEFVPRSEWCKSDYFDDVIEEVDVLMNRIISDPMCVDGCVVEMSLADDGWVPMRVRSDKLYPNSYRVGITNCGVMFAPVSVGDDSYFILSKQTSSMISSDVITAYHNVNAIIRKYIIEQFVYSGRVGMSVIDLAGGRGADELELFHCGVSSIFAIDADKEALTQYVNRTPMMFRKQWSPLKNIDDHKPKNKLLLNAIHGVLGKNNDELKNEIMRRYEYPKNGFDCILMNYALHYLCYSHECIRELGKLINSVLSKDGVFVFSVFDGDEIVKCAKNDIVDLGGVFKIKLIQSPSESDSDAVWAQMPLPTIDKTGYRNEPLVLSRWLNDLGLELVTVVKPVDECNELISEVGGYELVVDYLKFVRVYVMKRK